MEHPPEPPATRWVAPPEPAEPVPDRLPDRVVAWLDWIGTGRLVATAAAVVAVGGGAFWLLRSPPPPTTADLPRATAPPATAPPATTDGIVTVHVTGAVWRPGVYDLSSGARVHAAIERAGGATAEGDPDALNLAAALVDGARIHVPVIGEPLPPDAPGLPAPPGPVNVNQATIAELDELPGIGPATANAIVVERDRNGPFVSVDDLERVPGIGPAKVDALRDLVTT